MLGRVERHRRRTAAKRIPFDAQTFLDSAGLSKTVAAYARNETVYTQGDACDHVMYIQAGAIKRSVLSKDGREAVVAMLGPGDFFGEEGLGGQTVRIGSATAIAPSLVLVIDRVEMMRLLHDQPSMSDRFITHMLARSIRTEEDFVDQLFNSSEKRLARTLLLLAPDGAQDEPTTVVPKISQETLAKMIGTTRSRVNFFLNKFKRLGFIEYDGDVPLKINNSLLSVVLHD